MPFKYWVVQGQGLDLTRHFVLIILISQILLADLFISLGGYEHFNTGLINIINIRPVSLNLRILNTTCQAVNSSCSPKKKKLCLLSSTNAHTVYILVVCASTLPASEKNMFGLFDYLLQ